MVHLPKAVHRRRASLTTSSRGSSMDETRHEDVKDDETVMDSEQGSMLTHIISQLRPGADLSRVTLPTFILEPRSMLERITNFMAHPETLLPLTTIDDPIQRFVAVTKFYLSGWHLKPPGVKKPLNPILGEIYTCYWDYPDGTKGYYIAEQTSHHPPKSSYFFMAPEHNIRIDGTLKPRSKFLGNSAASMMEGIAVLRLLNTGERFFVTQPNMYARGILFGTMQYELGDHAYIRCPETGLTADIEFKTKGWVSGTYNAIGGHIKDSSGKNLFELSGLWSGEMNIKDLTTGKKELLFDASHSKPTPPIARPMEEQDERESQRLWYDVTEAVKRRDQNVATDAKALIEDRQREEAAKRTSDGVDWQPHLFQRVGTENGEEDLDWMISAKIDGKTPEEQVKQILSIHAILPGQKPDHKYEIPSWNNGTHRTPTEPPVNAASTETPQQNQITPASHIQQPLPPPQPQPASGFPSSQPASVAPTLVASHPQQEPVAGYQTSQHQLQQPSSNPTAHDGAALAYRNDNSNNASFPIPLFSGQPQHQPQHQLQTENVPSNLAEQVVQTNPPSKLLHSNPEPEPRRNERLRRMDSETREDEEFVDAQS